MKKITYKLTNEDYIALIEWANKYGYTIREHNHPKTRASWS